MKQKRILCMVLAAALIWPQPAAWAGAPVVSTDEAVYVNMDYYGQTTDISIVKSCNLNGVRQFTDFGDYSSVTNMSNHIAPVVEAEGVVWDLTGMQSSAKNTERFYYECKLKDNTLLVLPWSFDVSYRLNGVPAKGEDLAGKSGMVDIDIHAIPNENASEYAKNNMLLQVATTVNMDDTLSIDAPGAQIQALGAYKAVVFMALPGEEITFSVRIGTESFETTGITMMMVPGTLSQMQDIKDLKESKDKVYDAAHAVKDSMDDIITTMEGMSAGLNAAKQGFNQLEEGRAMLSEDRGQLYDYSDQAIVDMTNLTDNINALIPHMQQGQQAVTDVNRQVNFMVETLHDTKENVKSLQAAIKNIQNNVLSIQDSLEKADGYREDRRRVFDDLYTALGDMEGPMGGLQRDVENLANGMDDLHSSSKGLQGTMGVLLNNPITEKVLAGNVEGTLTEQEWAAYQAGLSLAGNVADKTAGDAASVAGQTASILQSMDTTLSHGRDAVSSMQELVGLSDIYIRIVEDNYNNNQELLDDINRMGTITNKLLTKLNRLSTQTEELNEIVNRYEPDVQSLLTDSQELTAQLNTVVFSSLNFVTALQASLRRSEASLDQGTQNTLNGMADVISQALVGITKTGNIKNANNLIQETVDNELDRFEEETNVLKMDGDLPRQSFTSAKNPEPESIQIILRTAEIEIDEDETITDLETSGDHIGIKGRIALVFKTLWEKIKGLFS